MARTSKRDRARAARAQGAAASARAASYSAASYAHAAARAYAASYAADAAYWAEECEQHALLAGWTTDDGSPDELVLCRRAQPLPRKKARR